MKKTMLILSLLLGVFLILGGLGSCRKNNETPQGGNAAEKPGKIIIYFIPKNMGNPYFDALSSGFYNAITQLGENNFQYYYTGPETAEAASQIPYIEEALQNKADAIFIAANSNDALNNVFDRARQQGTRIYIINQDIPGSESHRDAAILPVNFDTVGNSLMEQFGKQMSYKGKFAILSATYDAPDQNTWIGLIKEELATNYLYGRMELIEVVYGDDQYEKSTTEAEALLARYDDLKGIIAPTAVGLPAAAAVIREKGLSGEIIITGLGLPSEMAEFMADGTCEGFQLWNPPYEGYLGVYLIWAEKRSGFNPVPGAVFAAGRLGNYTIRPNGQILTLQTPMLYDNSNIREYAILF
jgi:rhamnose transport system substrate-binding protein